MINRFKGDFILIMAALFYGSGLVAQSKGNDLGPWTFTALRFLVGAVILIPVIFFIQRRKTEEEKASEYSIRQMLPGAFWIGAALVFMVLSQQYALLYTTVGKAGFISSLYVIGVPIAGVIFLHRKISSRVWVAAVISVIGFYFISLSGGFDALNKGDVILLGTALSCVVYFYTIEYFSTRADPFLFTMLQFLATGLLSLIGSLIFELEAWSRVSDHIGMIVYTGTFVCAIGYSLQMIGQKYVPSERATILLSTESLFSLFSGLIILHEVLHFSEYLGCALIFIAVILVETNGNNERTGQDI